MSPSRSATQVGALAILLLALTAAPAAAQSSVSYKLGGTTLNNGGDPRNGASPTSAHFRIRLDAIGDGAVRPSLASTSFHMDTGFIDSHPPAGEVTGLLLTALTPTNMQLQWNSLATASFYEVYRGAISTLPGGYGTCFAGGLTSTSTTDTALPTVNNGFFYMVTARNAAGAEGPKGYASNGLQQANPLPCP